MSQPASIPPLVQAPGIYRYRHGDFVVTTINDGGLNFPLSEGFVRNASLADVQAALADAYLPTDAVPLTFTPTLIETGTKRILFDTGFGGSGPPATGRLVENLAAIGIAPEAIDTVVIGHFHGDHIGGLRGTDGALTFPAADILVPEAEWAFWMDDARMAEAPERQKQAFGGARHAFGPGDATIRRFAADEEILPGITALAAYGHTPGHTAFSVVSGGKRLLLLSDTTNLPALFVRNPSWQAAFDVDPEEATSSRDRILGLAADEHLPIVGFHYPFPAIGHIERDGTRYRYVPMVWNPVP